MSQDKNKLYAVVYGILDAGLTAARTGETQIVHQHKEWITDELIEEGLALVAQFGWEITHRTETGWATWTRPATPEFSREHLEIAWAQLNLLDKSGYTPEAVELVRDFISSASNEQWNDRPITSDRAYQREHLEAAIELLGKVTDMFSITLNDVQMHIFEVTVPEEQRAATLAVDPYPRSVVHEQIFGRDPRFDERPELTVEQEAIQSFGDRNAMSPRTVEDLVSYGYNNQNLQTALSGDPTAVTRFVMIESGEFDGPNTVGWVANDTFAALAGRQQKPVSAALWPLVPQYVPLEIELIEAIAAELRSLEGLKKFGPRAEAIIAQMQKTGWLPIEQALELADKGIQSETLRGIVERHHQESLAGKQAVDWVVVSAADLEALISWIPNDGSGAAGIVNRIINVLNGPRLFQ